MRRGFLIFAGLVLCLGTLPGCNQTGKEQNKKSENKTSQSAIPEDRPKAKSKKEKVDLNKPVATYQANMEDEVTNNDFTVQVYPTENPKTFKVDIQFGGNKAQDKADFPPPQYFDKISLKKGDKPNSCILGFIGKKGKFNELKEIVCTTTSIKINTLKAYYFETK